MNKSPQNLKVKEKNAFWLSDHATKIESVLLALLFLLLPTQLGKHFWPEFSLVNGLRVDYLSPTLYTTDILIGLLFFFWIMRDGRSIFRDIFTSFKRSFLAIFVILFLLINIFNADRIGLSSYYGLKLLEYGFLVYYLAKHIRLVVHGPMIALLFAVGAFFQSFLAILQYIQQGSINGWLYFLGERTFTGATIGIANASINGELILRPYGTLPHPNVLAGYLLISILLIAAFLIPKARGFIRIFGLLTIVLASIAILFSLSRVVIGLYAALLLCGVLYWTAKHRPSPGKAAGWFILAAILDLLLFIGGWAFLQNVITRFQQSSLFEESFTQRSELISSTIAIILANPAFGVGLGHFIPALAPIQDPLSIGLFLQPVHNIYLLVAAEAGIIGFSLFILGILFTFDRIFQSIRLHPLFRTEFLVLSLMLAIILLIGFFDHYFLTVQQGQLLFAVILGLCWVRSVK